MPNSLLKKSTIGLGLAIALFLLAAYLILRNMGIGGGDAELVSGSTRALATPVEIKDKETGETWTLYQAQIESIVRQRPSPIDVNQGLPNPKTGKLTGFPTRGWEATIKKIEESRQAPAEDSSANH